MASESMNFLEELENSVRRQKEAKERFEKGMTEENFREMFELQKVYDDRVFREFGIRDVEERRWEAAWLDELGELNHELKSRWCWWKKTQKPENREKVLEELVDVWHFGLMYMHKCGDRKIDWPVKLYNEMKGIIAMTGWMPADCVGESQDEYDDYMAINLIGLSASCGFTMTEVYEAYKKKNAENHARMDRGY